MVFCQFHGVVSREEKCESLKICFTLLCRVAGPNEDYNPALIAYHMLIAYIMTVKSKIAFFWSDLGQYLFSDLRSLGSWFIKGTDESMTFDAP